MKSALKLSVLANIVLCAMLFCLARHPGRSASTPPTHRESVAAADSSKEMPRSEPQPFRWNQIESPDYRTYIAKLRGIGCPEQTIRDIIIADVHSLYAPRYEEFERKKSALDTALLAGRGAGQGPLGAELQRLQNEEASVLSALLNSQSLAAQSAGENSTFARVQRGKSREAAISMPLVFQTVNPAILKLDYRQVEVIDGLRHNFLDELGDPNPAPATDPAYRQRWQAAQRNNDELLSGLLGGQFFVEYQLAASPPP